jgi:TonB family protein
MGTYTRLGRYLLASELASDPFGAIHRAVTIAGSNFDRHVLVRTFSEQLFQAGVNTRMAEAGRVVPLLVGERTFGLGYRIESGKTPHVAWDYVPGRSLAQLIDKAKQEQIPFGVDHALTVIQGVAQGIVQMHAKGVSHGILSPHSVWVSFEGATQLVDAPFASLVRSLLAKAPSAMNKLAPYLQGTDKDPLQQDLFALGAVLYELLTFERLPVGSNLQVVLDRATLKAAQGEAPFPAEIRALLGRMLLGHQPFLSVEGFNAELERVLYGGEYSPTRFNMAFFMHTLFRDENDRDATAMKMEEGDNYLAYTAAGESISSGANRVDYMNGNAEAPPSQKNSTLLIGGGLASLVILGLGYFYFARPKEDPALQKQLAELQTLKMQMEQQKAEVDAKAKAQTEKTTQLQKQLTEAKSVDEKLKIEKQLEESKQRKLELERQQKAANQKLAEQKQNEQKLNEQRRASTGTLPAPPPPPPPVTELPKPQQPVPEAPKAAVGSPSTPPPVSQPAFTAAAVDEAARILTQPPPVYPRRAIQSRIGTNQDQRVRLKVFVNERGQVLKVSVIEGVGGAGGFDEAAVEAANRSTYRPATSDGKPVRGWTPDIVYIFKKRY